MKKIIAIVIGLCVFLCGCTSVETVENESSSMFVRIESAETWDVVYHKETKVMYVVSDGSRHRGAFTLLVNPDGTPMIYGGAK